MTLPELQELKNDWLTQSQAAAYLNTSYNRIKYGMLKGWLQWHSTPFGPLFHIDDLNKYAKLRKIRIK